MVLEVYILRIIYLGVDASSNKGAAERPCCVYDTGISLEIDPQHPRNVAYPMNVITMLQTALQTPSRYMKTLMLWLVPVPQRESEPEKY